ncbi:MAG TPA: UvrD-helicase domain-containing protein [Flavobacteriales bacterium]
MNNEKNFLLELNEAQRAAAAHINGPLMVIAGAGSGKTRVLTYRIAYLIQQGVDPFNILALTFTNKAAREMKERIGKLIGEREAKNIWMGTFHSIFARILRIEAERINYPSNFSIYDTADSKNLLKDILKEMGLDDKIYKPAIVYNRISACKNNLISPQDYMNNVEIVAEDRQTGKPKMGEIYAMYNQRLFKAGAMDFDDLLFKTNVLLRDFPDVLHKYQHKFKYILVDEYQDTNFSQYLIVKQLAAAYQNVCVVGDDAQSIYAFRGANIQNILNFRRDYPDYTMYKLEQNYRSTKTIVEAANGIISKNRDQIKKEVWTNNDQGNRIKVFRALTDNDEGNFVANQIFTTMREEGAKPSDFAILYRTNAQSRSFEEALRKLNVPYKIFGGLSFYQRKEIKDLIAYFRLVCNHNDEESFKRIVNYPKRGIGDTTIQKLVVTAAERGTSIWDLIDPARAIGGGDMFTEAPAPALPIIGNAAYARISEFVTLIKSFSVNIDRMNAYDLGHMIASESGLLKDLYADRTPEGVARYENIQELLNGMKEFSDKVDPDEPEKINTLSDFLIDVALLTDVENEDDNKEGKVSLMTIHAAKGLEFPYVNIVGLEENLFPSQLSLNSREELEEERRLFYVALTRAEKQVTLSYADTRYRWGQLQYGEPSRFIEEIDEKYLDMPAQEKKSPFTKQPIDFAQARAGFAQKTKPTESRFSKPVVKEDTPPAQPFMPPKNFKKVAPGSSPAAPATQEGYASPEEIQVGVEVMHDKFGKGKVLKIEGQPTDLKATIFFPTAGQKQLLLKFAKLKLA